MKPSDSRGFTPPAKTKKTAQDCHLENNIPFKSMGTISFHQLPPWTCCFIIWTLVLSNHSPQKSHPPCFFFLKRKDIPETKTNKHFSTWSLTQGTALPRSSEKAVRLEPNLLVNHQSHGATQPPPTRQMRTRHGPTSKLFPRPWCFLFFVKVKGEQKHRNTHLSGLDVVVFLCEKCWG